MSTPTITGITPSIGHSGGKSVVEITGTNFRVPSAPPSLPIPAAAAVPTVEVLFGSEPATDVRVWSATKLYCRAPRLDPTDKVVTVTANATTNKLSATGHNLHLDSIVEVASTGSLPAPLQASTPYYVTAIESGAFKLAASPGGAAIDLTSAGSGTITVTTDAAVGITVWNLDDAGEHITGESATSAEAFRPVRPNLSQPGHLACVLRAFLDDLRRQIVREVAWTTAQDWDDETGDLRKGAVAALPALLVADVSGAEGRTVPEPQEQEVTIGDPETDGNFVVMRRARLLDLEGNLVGVSDDPIEVLNLAQALTVFFDKTDRLVVPREDGSSETISYALMRSGEVALAPRSQEQGLSYCQTRWHILGVRIEDIPGLPSSTFSLASGLTAEAVTGVGRTGETVVLTSSPT